jgi:hypothetical protein
MEGARRGSIRSVSAESGPDVMACNTSGWTHAVLTNLMVPNSKAASTRCFDGTVIRPNAMSF